jgi:pimeloyl-ACP methyl ester carboxylesterase/DNA-binding CsgD family transcriptional regulator
MDVSQSLGFRSGHALTGAARSTARARKRGPSAAALVKVNSQPEPARLGSHVGQAGLPVERRGLRILPRVRPEVEYAHAGSGSIAFQILGRGSLDIVFVPGFVSHLDLAWEEPFLARFLHGLGKLGRLVWFDKQGTGLSDPGRDGLSLDDGVGDLLAVMDAAGSERAALFGVAVGAAQCLLFAMSHPERVSALILFGGHARLIRSEGYPQGWSEQAYAQVIDRLDEGWAHGEIVEMMNPSLVGDERFRSWFRRYCRAGASPAMARAVFRTCAAMDLRSVLGRVDVPTLLLHRVDDPWLSVEGSRYLADRLPGARLVELPGIDHWPWIGDSDRVLDEIEAFLTGARRARRRRVAWGPDALTRREREVVSLAVHGISARSIGEQLFISERTVESHIAHAYLKLGIRSRLELVRHAAEFGL